ncbi:MAG: polysaccharide deacetylase family protein [Acidobacteria bacterium]|nr:polysaccharide deacetylase family protein [Acidobacteriota bacterium]
MLTIFTYHSLDASGSVVSVTPAAFADQMACLARLGWRGISLREAIGQQQQTGQWPERCAVLTFDDGFANFFDVAGPILNRFGFSATVFLITGHVGGFNDWDAPPPGLGAQAMLTWAQVERLAADGIEFGSHTRTHPDLRTLTAQDAYDEIVGARSELEDRLGQTISTFAYPFGYLNDNAQQIVKQEFRAACTTVLRRANGDALHKLPRVDMYYIRSEQQFARVIAGELDGYLAFRRWGRSVRGALLRN